MNRLGIQIISCNIQKLEDENELIVQLGQDNMSQIQKKASIAKAEAERDVAVAQAKAKKIANDAAVEAETEIAKKNNELMIKQSELKREAEAKRAEAEAAYSIQEQNQRKSIEVSTANADIARQEREVELKARQVEVTEKALEAEVKKKAEAERYAAQQKAEADLFTRQKEAEAEMFEKFREAEGIKAVGDAEAEAIRAKGNAEAEAMEKRAEAYQKYNHAAIAEMIIKVLPEIASSVAEPLKQIDRISIIGNGSVEGVADNVPVVMEKMFESVKEATGIDLTDIINAQSMQAKITRNVNVSGINIDDADKSAEKIDTVNSDISDIGTDDITDDDLDFI